jgi:hypothetical protein
MQWHRVSIAVANGLNIDIENRDWTKVNKKLSLENN